MIGSPGSTTVFTGEDLQTRSAAYIKVVSFDPRSEPGLFEAALGEVKAIAAMKPCPDVVRVLDADQVPGKNALYLALMQEAGEPLERWIPKVGVDNVHEKVELAVAMARGLAHLHEQQIVHGQVHPSDFIVTRATDAKIRAKIQNFGFTRLPHRSKSRWASQLITSGQAPEQVVGQSNSFSTDIYSFGALLFELLADTLPLDRDSFPFVCYANPHQLPESHKSTNTPLVALLTSCLAQHPNERPQNALTIVSVLEDFLEHRPSAPSKMSSPPTIVPSLPSTSAQPSDAQPSRPIFPEPAQATTNFNPSPPSAPISGQQQGMSNLPESTQSFDLSALHTKDVANYMLDSVDQARPAGRAKPKRSKFLPTWLQVTLATLTVLGTAVVAMWFISGENDKPTVAPPPVARAAVAPPPPPLPTPVPQPRAEEPPAPPQKEPTPPPVPATPPKASEPVAKAAPKKPASTPSPKIKPRAPSFLTTLTDKDIRDALRSTRARIHAECPQPVEKTTVRAKVLVRPSGQVISVRFQRPYPEGKLGRCIARHARATQYPQRSRHKPSLVKVAFHVGGNHNWHSL